MDKYIETLSEKIMPFANKISGQRHLMAIRKGIVATMPLIIVGSFFTILLNIPIESIAIMLEPYLSILDIPFRFTVGIMSRSEEHTSELQSRGHLVCRLLLEKKKSS